MRVLLEGALVLALLASLGFGATEGLPSRTREIPVVRYRPLKAPERMKLKSLAGSRLEKRRAGHARTRTRLGCEERASLRKAERTRPDLKELRAGGISLSDREVQIVLITVGVIILIVLLV